MVSYHTSGFISEHPWMLQTPSVHGGRKISRFDPAIRYPSTEDIKFPDVLYQSTGDLNISGVFDPVHGGHKISGDVGSVHGGH